MTERSPEQILADLQLIMTRAANPSIREHAARVAEGFAELIRARQAQERARELLSEYERLVAEVKELRST